MSNNEQQIKFPDLAPLLYDPKLRTITEVLNQYIEEIDATIKIHPERKIYLEPYKEKIKIYTQKFYNHSSLRYLETLIDEFKFFLHSLGIPFEVYGRVKDVKRFIRKVRSFIYDGLDPFLINDEFGFRVVIGTSYPDTEESIKLLYDTINTAFENFFVGKKHFSFGNPSPKNDTGFNPDFYPNVFVPKKSLLKEEYIPFVKDYFIDPKSNGYQALHAVLESDGRSIEMQVRTFASDYHATFLANHEQHEKERYSVGNKKLTPAEIEAKKIRESIISVQYDPELVILNNYYSSNGNTLDRCGLGTNITNPFNNFYI